MAVTKPILLDSNIVIYTGITTHDELRHWLKFKNTVVSSISKLEVLGYHSLNKKDRIYFEAFFKQCKLIIINSEIIDLAVRLRQSKSMSLGDAIIAATASLYKFTLVTANTKDFKHIEKLKLINPLEI